MFVSDYLTTPGQKAEEDFRMIADLGFEITAGDYESSKLLDLWNTPHTKSGPAENPVAHNCCG
jgi:biotin synthase